MRTEFNEQDDTVTTVMSDNPIVRVEEDELMGAKTVVSYDAQGRVVKSVMHGVSKLREMAAKQENETFAADPTDERIVNEFSWSLHLPGAEAIETFHVRAPLKSFRIRQTKSPEKTTQVVIFPIGGGFNLEFAVGEPSDTLPVGWAVNPRRSESKGFSWEWFQQRTDRRYFKIQEGGEAEVQTRKVEGKTYIVAIEFLTDVSLRFRDGFPPLEDAPFGRVNIQKGVVLRWPVLIGGRVVLLD